MPIQRASNWSCHKYIISVSIHKLDLWLLNNTRIWMGPDVACHPVNNTTRSCQELWNKPETITEFYEPLLRFISGYTWDLGVLALEHPKNLLGIRALREFHSRTCFIMCNCTLTCFIQQSKTYSFSTKQAHATWNYH